MIRLKLALLRAEYHQAGGLDVHRNTGERVKVSIERHGGEQDFHESVTCITFT